MTKRVWALLAAAMFSFGVNVYQGITLERAMEQNRILLHGLRQELAGREADAAECDDWKDWSIDQIQTCEAYRDLDGLLDEMEAEAR